MGDIVIVCLVIGALYCIGWVIMEQNNNSGPPPTFTSNAEVMGQVKSIDRIRGSIALVECYDGRWGIINGDGWLNQGGGKYICQKWKERTGEWPYIYYGN